MGQRKGRCTRYPYSTMKSLSVVQVSQWGGRGGGPNIVLGLARALQSTGVQSSVLCLADGPLVKDLRRLGIPTEVVTVSSKYDVRGIFRLYSRLRGRRFDVVHTHGPTAMFMGNVAARLARVTAVVTTIHGLSDIRGLRNRYRIFSRLEGLLGRWCSDACVTYSARVRADSISARGIPPGGVLTIHNGINVDVFHPLSDPARRMELRRQFGIGPDDFVIGAVGELIAVKGHLHLVAAMARIVQELPRARLLMLGAGPLRDELARAASRGGVRDRLVLAGDLRADSGVYGTMDVLVFPSLKGVFGIVMLEAMACGIPVVASGLEGTDELVTHEQNGLLVPPGDEKAIAEAVLRVSRDPRPAPASCRIRTQHRGPWVHRHRHGSPVPPSVRISAGSPARCQPPRHESPYNAMIARHRSPHPSASVGVEVATGTLLWTIPFRTSGTRTSSRRSLPVTCW